jgi:hypothetical protein
MEWMLAKMDFFHAKMDAIQEMLAKVEAKVEAHHERMVAKMDIQLEKMEACLGATEAVDLEANPEEIESEVEYEEVPKEEAAVETFRALEKWRGDQYLAVRFRG